MNFYLMLTIELIMNSLLTMVPILGTIAFFTLAESKIMGSVQRSTGPAIVGYLGLLQPLADGLKLIMKEMVMPISANSILFLLAPAMTLILGLWGWIFLPLNYNNCYFDADFSILFILLLSSFGVYGMLLAGWASNSKYAFLGALRSGAQMIAYEISMGTILLPVMLCSGSFNLMDIVYMQQELGVWFFFMLMPLSMIFFISCLAETNRAPFDLPEAEAELVAGYNVEYSSVTFAMFFLGEYSNMILMSAINVIFFWGGWELPGFFKSMFFPMLELIFSLKVMFFCVLFIWVRSSLPSFSYDQLMDIGWKYFLPLTFGYFLLVVGLIYFLDVKPFIFMQVPFLNQFDMETYFF